MASCSQPTATEQPVVDDRATGKTAVLGTPARVALAAALVFGFLAGARLVAYRGDVTRFIDGSTYFIEQAELPSPVTLRSDRRGFDGQFFFLLALDPSFSPRPGQRTFLDEPAYRQQRIGYPLLVHVLSFGAARAVPWVMVVVNLAAVTVIAFLGAWLCRHFGSRPELGLLAALCPAYFVSVGHCTSEAAGMAFALGAVAAYVRGRHGLAAVLLTAAMLTRETTLLIGSGLGVATLMSSLREPGLKRLRWIAYGLPVAAWAVWQAALARRWGMPGYLGAPQDFGFPFAGMVRGLFRYDSFPERLWLYAVAVGVLGAIVLAARAVLWRRVDAALRVSWVIAVTLLFLLTDVMWGHSIDLTRACSETWVASLLVIAASRSPWSIRWAPRLLLPAAAACLYFIGAGLR